MNLISLKGNTKLGTSVVTTTLPIRATCSTDCMHHPDREGTCYAYNGPMMWHQRKMESAIDPSWDIGGMEANQLAALAKPGALVRLHVAGEWIDSSHTKRVLRVVKSKSLKAWAYTHKWRKFKATSFKGLSILASCDSLPDAIQAWIKGYAPALVVPKFESYKAYDLKYADGSDTGLGGIPCPAQTKHVTCEQCKLCLKADWLHRTQQVILFEAHGSRGKKLASKLISI
jgi:hypothetical protein